MPDIYVCRDLYPTWQSTKRYLNNLKEGIALFPEESLGFGRDWSIDDLALHLANKPVCAVGSYREKVAVVAGGRVEYHGRREPPIPFVTRSGVALGLVRICSDSLLAQPEYPEKARFLLVTSSLPFEPPLVIEKHKRNLTADAVVAMSSYRIKECYSVDTGGLELGVLIEENKSPYVLVQF